MARNRVRIAGARNQTVQIPGDAIIGVSVWNADGTLFQPQAGQSSQPDVGIALDDVQTLGPQSVTVTGSMAQGALTFELDGDVLAPGNTYYYGTGPTGVKGFNTVASALAVASTGRMTQTIGTNGVSTFDLATVSDAGGGSLLKFVRDAWGRITGTSAPTTTDLPEGTNLYYTDARADARITLQKGQPSGLATLDVGGKLVVGQLPAIAITDTFVVASQAAMLALAAQQGDVAIRTDLHDSFILTTNDPTVLANWQELETPVDGVATFNGRTGNVLPAAGDYVTTQVAEGSNLYFTAARVLATVLAGLSTATNAVITAADTVLSALGKLQTQISANVTALAGKLTASNNLSDVANAATARGNLGVVIPQGYIDGLQMVWNSATSISVTSGTAYIPSLANVLASNSTLTLSGLSLAASTWYHIYLYSNAGTPAIECVTTAPVLYYGTAYQKTGDSSRRYVGSVLTDASTNIRNFKHDESRYFWMQNIANGIDIFRILNGNATAPTVFSGSSCMPITAYSALLRGSNTDPTYPALLSAGDYVTVGNDGQISLKQNLVEFFEMSSSSTQSFKYFFINVPTGTLVVDLIAFNFLR